MKYSSNCRVQVIVSACCDDRLRIFARATGEGWRPAWELALEKGAHEGDVNCARWHPQGASGVLASARGCSRC